MEIVGGFMVMMSILGFFLVVIWFAVPFVVFAVKAKADRTLVLLESVEQRLAAIEERLARAEAVSAPDGENERNHPRTPAPEA